MNLAPKAGETVSHSLMFTLCIAPSLERISGTYNGDKCPYQKSQAVKDL